jgi:hypothetical protein
MSELSLIQFNFTNYFAIIINHRPFNPIHTILIKLVQSLIDSENEPKPSDSNYEEWKSNKEKVEWINKNTHEKIMFPLPIVELMVFRNLGHSVGKEISIDDKDFQLIDLYRYLDDVVSELTKIVISIGRRYNLEIPLNIHGRTTTTTSNAII